MKEPYSVDPAYGGPEYETLAALGSNCGVDDLKAIGKGNELCNAYALDTISVGGTITFAMECFEKGLLSIKDTDEIELRFGNQEAMLKVIELIAKREGIGDLLAEGTAQAAKRLGKGAEEAAMQVKGLELAMHDPQLKLGLGLGYMVNPHGADHVCNMHDPMFVSENQLEELRPLGMLEPFPLEDIGPHKVALFKAIQTKMVIVDSLVLCFSLPYTYEQMARLVEAFTGWDTGVVEQLKVGERILTTARVFNVREGLNAADDMLPRRFFQSKENGPLFGKPVDPAKLERAKNYYYALMGWDSHTEFLSQKSWRS